MTEKIIPDTEAFTIAVLAAALEIAKITNPAFAGTPPDERLKILTNSVIKAYQAILTNKPIEK